MNLLYTITAYPPSIGGAQAHFHQLARQLSPSHHLQVAAHWGETRTDWLLGTTLTAPAQAVSYELDGIPVRLLSFTRGERLRLAPWVMSYYLLRGPAISYIADLLVRHLEPLAHGVNLIHNGRIGREPLSFASLKLARQLGVPFLFTPFHHPRWVGWPYRQYAHLYHQADGVIALTHTEKETLCALGVQPERVFVTGMGPMLAPTADGESFRQRFGLKGGMVLFVGQKYRYKGIDLLLKAAPQVWDRHPQTHFVFIGPRTRYSRRLFRQYRERRILELGEVDLETKTNALAACDLLCLPSSQESFGAVLVEAWMLGKPVIGSQAPAVREVIAEGQDGYVVPPQAEPLAACINHLLDRPALGRDLGERGREKALAHYNWPHLARQTEAAYYAVLERSCPRPSQRFPLASAFAPHRQN